MSAVLSSFFINSRQFHHFVVVSAQPNGKRAPEPHIRAATKRSLRAAGRARGQRKTRRIELSAVGSASNIS